MKIGLGIPHLGRFADPDAARAVAVAADSAHFSSLWAMDRLLSPVAPRTMGYPGHADGSLPQAQQHVLDPLVTLTLAAAVTHRIRLGTDVLVAPWYPPVLLARTLAALDQVSRGRLTVGLGLGWSVDEFEAVGVPMERLGNRLEEVLDVLTALWSPGPSSIVTSRERIASSIMGVKPAQTPPPIVLAAFNPAGLDRVARRADGWLPFGLGPDEIEPMWSIIQNSAERYGRDSDRLQLIVRADPAFTDHKLSGERPPFTGTRTQIVDDINRVRDLGATELILDLQTCSRTVDELLDTAFDLSERSLTLVAA